jgi:hypothetical protein
LDKISPESIQATIDAYAAQRDGLNALIAELVKKKEMVKEMEAKI